MNRFQIFVCVCVGLVCLPSVIVYHLVKPTIDAWVANSWRGIA